jgi:hypothetical protein
MHGQRAGGGEDSVELGVGERDRHGSASLSQPPYCQMQAVATRVIAPPTPKIGPAGAIHDL